LENHDPDGDIIIAEVVVIGPEKTMKFMYGTGKWKGIKGEAKGKTTAAGRPAAPETMQACSSILEHLSWQNKGLRNPAKIPISLEGGLLMSSTPFLFLVIDNHIVLYILYRYALCLRAMPCALYHSTNRLTPSPSSPWLIF